MNSVIENIRKQFPYLGKTGGLIYFDNAATSQKPQAVIDMMTSSFEESNANVHRAVYEMASRATDLYEQGREAVRTYINAAAREEVVFTSGTTASINLLANIFGEQFISAGDEILISEGEHHSNMVPWMQLCARKGAKLRYIPVDNYGQWDLSAAETVLKDGRVKLVSAAHISNVLGLVNPVEQLADMAHRYGAMVHFDGAQGIVHEGIDVQKVGCDFYSFSGHKLYASTGTGIFYGRKEILETMQPWMGGGEMVDTVTYEGATWAELPLRFEAGTPNFIAGATFRPAIEFVSSIRTKEVKDYEKEMTDYLKEELGKIAGLRVVGQGENKIPLFSFSVDGIHHSDIATLLDKMNIAVRSGLMCSEPLINKFGQTGLVRISLAPYNTLEECEAFMKALHRAVRMLGQ